MTTDPKRETDARRRQPSSPPKVRLQDVAQAAKVSPATVSRVMNNAPAVAEELRVAVTSAAMKLGYMPHGAARALASRRSRALGVVVPNLSQAIFADTIEGFQRRMERQGYTMLLATFDYDAEAEHRSVRTMIERGVDGLMLVGVTRGEALQMLLRSSGIPFVQILALARDSEDPTIGYDNAKAARLLVDHMVGLGHRDIGVVAGLTQHNDRVRARIAGLRAALRRHGIALPARRIVNTEYRIAAVRAAFRKLQKKGDLPTALIANNDLVAVGLLLEAQSQGIQVPGQLSIAGTGDFELSAHMQPALTTVRTPNQAMGTMAADHLLARINGREFAVADELPLELVVRGSTAPPP